ncbi:unnamed protein product [Plutella xylostella]|uniref:(diamondback moth) hypothetical protein n=1 Tax=Plutella xylostella TaxID=51655 RepID=A0A8S4G9E9_PLUXY|nr:unnamed protein product [Plutella xylostella]
MEGSQAGIKLEGSKNWNVWKFQTMVVLRGHGLLDVVEGREVKPEAAGTAAEAWASKDAKAQTFLVTRMTEEVMLHIITCSSSADMWKKLASVYEQKTETSVHIVQQRFFQYKYEEGIEMAVFLSKVQEMKNQLKQMNEDISDKLVITKVLMSLPEDFSHFISAWESAPDDKQTYDNLVARLLVEEERIKEKRSESNQSSAFMAKRFDKKSWLVDSGASEHMCCDRELFSSYSTLSQKSVIVGNGTAISAMGRGQVAAQVFNGSEWIDTTIDNVLFVPELKTNLFSVNRAADRGYVMLTDDSGCKFYKQKQVCAIANRVGNMYYMDLRYKNSAANVTQVKSELYEWHERLVHQNMQYVKTVLAKNNIQVQDSDVDQCQGCLEGKIHKLPFSTSETKTSRTCELIHADTCGPMEETSVGGSRYFVILKDDYSNYRSVYFVKGKDEVKKCIEDFINQSQNITGNKVKTFRSDNGLEFVNKEVKQLFQLHGIVHQTTVPYTPEQNGKAERENRTLVEAARTMLYSKDMPKKLWAEAINTAAYVLNRTGKSNEPGKTPFETWTKETFDINTLKIFGTPVFVHIPKEKRRKWDSKGEKGVMVGYGQHVKGYRIYFPNKNDVETKRDVVFIEQKERTEVPEEREPLVSLDVEAGMSEPSYEGHVNEECAVIQQNVQDINVGSDDRPGESSDSEYEPCATSEESAEEVAERPDQEVWRGQRTRKPNPRYTCNNVTTETEYPSTYQEAMRRKDASKWEEAVKRELDTLKENETWTICEGHDGHNSVSFTSWFESYLKGRKQCVRTDSESSTWCPVLAGVPQGGVLSPLLFSLFINILANKLTSLYHLYADDLQLYTSAPPEHLNSAISLINTNLEIISKWVKSFGLLLNPTKSQAIVFGSSRMLRKIDFAAAMRVRYDQSDIPYVTSVKNLGVIMDNTLSWVPQVDAVSRKLFASFHSLKRLQYFLPFNTKVTLAQSLLLPILDYADVSYLDLTEELLNKLERLQNLCIRFIFGLRKYDHISEYRAQLKWLPIRLRRNTHILNMLFNVLNNPSSPQYLKSKFSFLCSHGRALRSTENKMLSVPDRNAASYSDSFAVKAACLWNTLPVNVRLSPSLATFKKSVKDHYYQTLGWKL